MPVTMSGLYVAPWINDMVGAHAINWDLETHKCALLTNVSTPAFSSAAAAAVYGAGAGAAHTEATGAGYVAGGNVLTATTVTEAPATVLMFDAADVSWLNSTITGARAALIYADAITVPAAKPAIVCINFGADYATNNGTFTIQWAASGVFTWDLY